MDPPYVHRELTVEVTSTHPPRRAGASMTEESFEGVGALVSMIIHPFFHLVSLQWNL